MVFVTFPQDFRCFNALRRATIEQSTNPDDTRLAQLRAWAEDEEGPWPDEEWEEIGGKVEKKLKRKLRTRGFAFPMIRRLLDGLE